MWIYQDKEFQEADPDDFGFIYQITNLTNKRKYIGKKQFWSNRTKKVVGKKNRKHYTLESDWKKYWSSCDELKDDVKTLGADSFERRILKICKTKGDLTFSEVEYQFKLDVLSSMLPDKNLREYYNANIMNRWFAKKINK
jgi:hypothetical protein